MSRLFGNLMLFLLVAAFSIAMPAAGNQPDDRDRQVLNSLFSHLLVDSSYNLVDYDDLARTSAKKTKLVLHLRTPQGTGFLSANQINSDLRRRALPAGSEESLRRRNTQPNLKSTSFAAINASFKNMKFGPDVVIADLEKIQKDRLSYTAFKKAYPSAKGWIEAYLPGYSSDGNSAVVRAFTGPTAHDATITAVLEKNAGTWVVRWYHVAHYL